jgi:hypothetical protein
MMRIFSLLLFLPFALHAQTGTRIISYSVAAAMNERSSEITGTIAVKLMVTVDSMKQYTFLVPKEMQISSVSAAGSESVDIEREQTNYTKYAVTIRLPEFIKRDDSLSLSFPYTSQFDTSSFAPMFVNQKEFLLPLTDSTSWLPNFGAVAADQYSFEFTAPSPFTLVAESKFDTAVSGTLRTWKHGSSHTTSLFSAFTCCGIANASAQSYYGNDSLKTISLVSSPARFNQEYAAAIVRQMHDAFTYFAAVTGGDTTGLHRTYAVIGSDQYNTNFIDTKNFIIHHNSPAYLQFDSIALTSPMENKWLMRAAKYFCPASTDSTALFNNGFASYLVARFLASRFPAMEKEERFNAIASSLTFFPYGRIAAGRTSKANSSDIFSVKGRYIFLMLDYILGRESFDSVIVRMDRRFSAVPVTFPGFQQLCEEEYGSSLGWFFDQWLHKTSAPEFVLQWKNERTIRGMTTTRLQVEQRGDLFSTPVNVTFQIGTRVIQKRIMISQQKQEFSFTFSTPPVRVELDPNYNVLRWLLEIRILAHARSAQLFLSMNRDTITAEREALYTLQLDPNNSTGSIPFAYYTLGKIAVIKNDLEKAKEYFLKAMPLSGTRETESYKLWSLIRYANVLEMEGKRDEAVGLLQRAIAEGRKNPLIFERTTIEASKYLRDIFVSSDDIWYGVY